VYSFIFRKYHFRLAPFSVLNHLKKIGLPVHVLLSDQISQVTLPPIEMSVSIQTATKCFFIFQLVLSSCLIEKLFGIFVKMVTGGGRRKMEKLSKKLMKS
jgi:hypothetical protein